MILEKRLISGNPRNIEIARTDRPPVFPCRKSYGPDLLDISQLDWAAENRSFWFLGPIKSLNVVLNGGSTKGKLELGVNNVLTFNTHFNALGFKDFTATLRKLEETANELGLKTCFEGDPTKYQDIKLSLSTEKSLSESNVRDFIDAGQKVILTNHLK